jgi:MFS family permease
MKTLTAPAYLANPPTRGHTASLGVARSPWVMVAVCTALVAMAFGAINNISVFLAPLAADFGWRRAELSLAYSIATLATWAGGVLMGHFADRMPVRRIALCGALACGLALIFLSQLDSTLELYLFHAMLGLFGIGAILAPLNSLASQWLARNPGLAIGIVSAGGAAGQGLIPYFARQLVVTEGWREAYLILGLLYVGVMVPLALLVRDAPRADPVRAAPAGQGSGRLLMLLSLAAVLCCVCMATPLVHVVTLGSDLGLAGRDAAGLLAVMMIAGMAGRMAFGRLADRVGSLRTYMAASFGQTLLAFLFPYAADGPQLYVLSALFGMVYSGAMTSFILCAREYAPAGSTARSIGIVMFFAWVGMALGAWQGGVFYDLCGTYYRSFANASLAGVVNLLILALLFLHSVGMRKAA